MSFFSEVEKAIEREFRKWTQKAFGPAESDQLLLVHRAILEEVESKIQTVQRGKVIFPYNHLLVRLAAADPHRRALLQAAFGQNRRLENDIRESYQLGANAYIVKPVEFRSFARVLRQFEIFWMQINQPAPERPVSAATRWKRA